jgi:Xaa-Pro aminopeptidase
MTNTATTTALSVVPHQARRQKIASQLRSMGGGVAVLMTSLEAPRNRDSDFPFRWDSYFYYLTGFPEPEGAVIISTTDTGFSTTLFCREKNEEREIWDGYRYGPTAAKTLFAVDDAHPISEFDSILAKRMANQPNLLFALGDGGPLEQRVNAALAVVRGQARSGIVAPKAIIDIRSLVDEMRIIKDKSEVATMRKAATISANAHTRAMQQCKPGMFEYQVEAELLYEFKKNGSQFPAYSSIVAGGANACVLHYRENSAKLRSGDLLLIDAGCELDGYASDITRTFPVNGKFSSGQRKLYDLVLDSQAAAIAATKPGAIFNAPHEAATNVLVRGMIDLGLLSGTVEEALSSGSYKRFYMHRTSHWIGMDVHDCGDYIEPGTAAVAVSDEAPLQPAIANRILRPGMVLTIEPGIYVRAAQDIPEEFHNVGIRIEDDALITESGCDILTKDVVKSAKDIEALMLHH